MELSSIGKLIRVVAHYNCRKPTGRSAAAKSRLTFALMGQTPSSASGPRPGLIGSLPLSGSRATAVLKPACSSIAISVADSAAAELTEIRRVQPLRCLCHSDEFRPAASYRDADTRVSAGTA